MRRIILASKSKARKILLERIGLKFTVTTTHVKESRSLKRGVSVLVIENALAKAMAAAKKYHNGVVIAADTVVLAQGKLIGKPKNLQDAQRIIKLLSQKPHLVYTGVAIIDIESNKRYTAWDRTKVYMSFLSSRKIKNYCRKYLPFDKAGSFDIQGPGALLVERIEGCFYNVVGLPLAKLAKILVKLKIDIFNEI
ncbi:MAG: Maf family protein [Candidatus Omnitrophota bacterium]|nr:Maf family protein [Candidatus Omnitrophota bacterium]